MSKILVTGASGNVGKYVTKYLIEQNLDVVVADVHHSKLAEQYGKNTECRKFDYLKQETYDDVVYDVGCVFIMRPPHIGDPKLIKPFIDKLSEQKQIKMVCFLSLLGIEKNPIPPHYKIEKYIEKSGLPFCHIRPSFFMQNLSGVHAFEVKHFDKIVVPVGNALTSFIDTEDIGEVIAKVLSEPESHVNKSYSITGQKALSYYDIEKIFSEELGRKISYTNPKPSFAKKYWIEVRGMDKKYATIMGLLYMMTRMGTAKKITTSFEELMEKKPKTFRSFVKENIHVWK